VTSASSLPWASANDGGKNRHRGEAEGLKRLGSYSILRSKSGLSEQLLDQLINAICNGVESPQHRPSLIVGARVLHTPPDRAALRLKPLGVDRVQSRGPLG